MTVEAGENGPFFSGFLQLPVIANNELFVFFHTKEFFYGMIIKPKDQSAPMFA